MCCRLFALLGGVLVLVSGQWQYGEALQKDSLATRKHQLDPPYCDTFFHVRNMNGEEVRPVALQDYTK